MKTRSSFMPVNNGPTKKPMSTIKEGLASYRERELSTPTVEVLNSRVPKPFYARVKSKALELKSSPSQLYRFLAAEGAAKYGIDLLSVM